MFQTVPRRIPGSNSTITPSSWSNRIGTWIGRSWTWWIWGVMWRYHPSVTTAHHNRGKVAPPGMYIQSLIYTLPGNYGLCAHVFIYWEVWQFNLLQNSTAEILMSIIFCDLLLRISISFLTASLKTRVQFRSTFLFKNVMRTFYLII